MIRVCLPLYRSDMDELASMRCGTIGFIAPEAYLEAVAALPDLPHAQLYAAAQDTWGHLSIPHSDSFAWACTWSVDRTSLGHLTADGALKDPRHEGLDT